jgi:hypothetical protein
MRCAIVLLALATACYEPPDYQRTHFACKKSSLCPEGLVCSEDHCVDPSHVDELTLIEHVPPFLITRDEVTEADYARCAAAASCPGPASIEAPDAPILGLSEAAASAFCRYTEMRLPTDDEWAAADRADVVRGHGVRCARSVE